MTPDSLWRSVLDCLLFAVRWNGTGRETCLYRKNDSLKHAAKCKAQLPDRALSAESAGNYKNWTENCGQTCVFSALYWHACVPLVSRCSSVSVVAGLLVARFGVQVPGGARDFGLCQRSRHLGLILFFEARNCPLTFIYRVFLFLLDL